MSTTTQVLELEMAALQAVCEVYRPPLRDPENNDRRHLRTILLAQRMESVRGRMQYDQDEDIKRAKELGQQRFGLSEHTISEDEVEMSARVDLDVQIDRVKQWVLDGKDAVAELYRDIEK